VRGRVRGLSIRLVRKRSKADWSSSPLDTAHKKREGKTVDGESDQWRQGQNWRGWEKKSKPFTGMHCVNRTPGATKGLTPGGGKGKKSKSQNFCVEKSRRGMMKGRKRNAGGRKDVKKGMSRRF